MFLCQPQRDKTDARVCYLLTAAGAIKTRTRLLFYTAVFSISRSYSFCFCFINSALSSQGESITIIRRNIRICSSSMRASGSCTQTCIPSQRCHLASTRQSGLPATVSINRFLSVSLLSSLFARPLTHTQDVVNACLIYIFQLWLFSSI